MKLKPLPTAMRSNRKETSQLPFPYPSLTEGKPSQSPPSSQLLTPFLQQPDKQPATHQNHSENTRMNELENMLSEAQSRAAIIEQEAYDKAYAAGEKSGLALGEKRAEQILESMQMVLREAEQELISLQSQSVDAVMDISHSIIEHVMGEVEQDVEKLLETSIKKALNQFISGYDGGVTLAVNPQDLSMFKRMVDLPPDMKIHAYPDVTSGTCRFMTAKQDVLIDPKQSIQDAVVYVRERLTTHG